MSRTLIRANARRRGIKIPKLRKVREKRLLEILKEEKNSLLNKIIGFIKRILRGIKWN